MKNALRAGGLNRRFICAAMMAVVGGAAAAYADAPTYYVSTSGSDLNDGLTPQTPWATIGQVDTASASFVPGTSVLLERGDVWGESLLPQSSGAAGNPITYSAYGSLSAPKPELLGSDVISGDYTSLGNSAYSVATAAIPGAVYLNHDFLHPAEILAGTSSPVAYVENNADTYYYDSTSGSLYVNTGGVAINNSTITATRRQNIVNTNNQSYLVFDNLQTDETAQLDGGYGFLAAGGSNITFQNDDAFRAGKHHFGAFETTGFVGRNLNAEYTMPDQASLGGASAYVAYGDFNGPANETSEWDNISASNLGDGEAFITHGASIASLVINNLNAPGYGVLLNADVQFGAVKIKGGVTGEIRDIAPGTVIDGTTIVNAVLYLQGSDNTVQNVVMTGLAPGETIYRGGIVIGGSNNTVRFSTLVYQTGGLSDAAAIVLLNGSGTSIYGNVIAGLGNYINNFTGQSLQSLSFYSDNNLFEMPPAMELAFAHSLSGAQWKALGYDVDSVIGNPQFTDAANGDYSLQAGSPGIGVFSGAFWQVVVNDIYGNSRLTGGAIDLGAIQTIPAGAVIISASADSDLGESGAGITLHGDTIQINGDAFNQTSRVVTLGSEGGIIEVSSATNTFTLDQLVAGGTLGKTGPGRLVLPQNYTNSGLTLISGGVLEFAGAANASGQIFGAGTLQVDAQATLVAKGIAVYTLQVDGTVQIRESSDFTGTTVTNSLVLGGAKGAWTGGIDLTNNALIVEDVSGHADALARVKDQVLFGRAQAGGIYSSLADGHERVAVVDNAVARLTAFGGTEVDSGSILVVNTFLGDSNLDGKVDIEDLTAVANSWQQAAGDWSQGDFDGNGVVDISDLTAIANNWQAGVSESGGAGSSSMTAALELFAGIQGSVATPEPGSLFGLVVGVPLLLSRKRAKKA